MKTRHGFVSNSSSSSFVVAVKKCKDGSNNEDVPIRISMTIDLAMYSHKRIATLDELDEYKKEVEEFGNAWVDYEKCKRAIKKGKAVLIGKLSGGGDGGDVVSEMLRQKGIEAFGLPRGTELISNEEG